MSKEKRSTKKPAVSTAPVAATDNTESKSEFDEANEQALKDAAKVEEQKSEETPAPETKTEESAETSAPADNTPPEGACEVWGQCDQNSKACKSCPVLDACKVVTTAAKPGKAAKSSTPRVAKPKTGIVSKFSQSDLGKQNGMIDTALETPRTMAELATETGCSESRVRSHIKWLETNRAELCKKVIGEGGKIHFELLAPVAAPAE